MSALLYLYTRSLKNRLLVALKSPKFIVKALGLVFFGVILVVSALTGVFIRGELPEWAFTGVLLLLFLVPYFAGRFSGGGSYEMSDVNFVFTAPILPRSVVLSGLFRRLGGMVLITVFIVVILGFMSTRNIITMPQILWAGVFGFVLMVVCKLFGMYLFVEYKKALGWEIRSWVFFLVMAVIILHVGFEGLTNYPLLLLAAPVVGWAAGGANSFASGQMIWGIGYTALLLWIGGYFFRAVYRSSPDFYDEALAGDGELKRDKEQISGVFRGTGAQVFFYKQIKEIIRAKGGEIFGIIGWMVFAILWGIYARNPYLNIDGLAILFMMVGVPSNSILAVLLPLIFSIALSPKFDRGFGELNHQYFYMLPDGITRKLLWASMSRVIYVGVVSILVISLGGFISRTAPDIVFVAVIAYITGAFMVLGVRAATVGLFALGSGAGKKLAATLPVLFFVLVGWVGMMAIFFLQPFGFGLFVALMVFSAWCGVIGGLGFLIAVKTLHNLDAPV